MKLTRLSNTGETFPPVTAALEDPNGLLAIGGKLTVKRLVAAYSKGIFPWYEEDSPILWWSPDPRAVIFPDKIKISKSLAKKLKAPKFQVTFNQNFSEVISACAHAPRKTPGTWITEQMQSAYLKLHNAGYAKSIEVWQADKLVGGLYGVLSGDVFSGESMFSRIPDASKIAFCHIPTFLPQVKLIDCQVPNDHLTSLGAQLMARAVFLGYLPK